MSFMKNGEFSKAIKVLNGQISNFYIFKIF